MLLSVIFGGSCDFATLEDTHQCSSHRFIRWPRGRLACIGRKGYKSDLSGKSFRIILNVPLSFCLEFFQDRKMKLSFGYSCAKLSKIYSFFATHLYRCTVARYQEMCCFEKIRGGKAVNRGSRGVCNLGGTRTACPF